MSLRKEQLYKRRLERQVAADFWVRFSFGVHSRILRLRSGERCSAQDARVPPPNGRLGSALLPPALLLSNNPADTTITTERTQ